MSNMRKVLAAAVGVGVVATAFLAHAQMQMPNAPRGGDHEQMQNEHGAMQMGGHGALRMHELTMGRMSEHAEMGDHAAMRGAMGEGMGEHMGAGGEGPGRVAALPPDAVVTPTPVQGEIVRIDPDSGRVTLRHEAIPNLDMRAMTMVFRVESPELLKDVKVGDRVTFEAARVEGALTLTKLQRQTATN